MTNTLVYAVKLLIVKSTTDSDFCLCHMMTHIMIQVYATIYITISWLGDGWYWKIVSTIIVTLNIMVIVNTMISSTYIGSNSIANTEIMSTWLIVLLMLAFLNDKPYNFNIGYVIAITIFWYLMISIIMALNIICSWWYSSCAISVSQSITFMIWIFHIIIKGS